MGNRATNIIVSAVFVALSILILFALIIFLPRKSAPVQDNSYLVVTSPKDPSVFEEDALIIFQASHTEDIVDFTWYSDLDGYIGEGREHTLTSSDMSEGKHIITLVGLSKLGYKKSDQSTILISHEKFIEPPKLNISPVSADLYMNKEFNKDEESNSNQRIIALRSEGDEEIDWETRITGDWIILNELEGRTPANVVVSFETEELELGGYPGRIEFLLEDEDDVLAVFEVKLCLKDIEEDSFASVYCGNVYPDGDL